MDEKRNIPVEVQEAKQRLTELVARAAKGDVVVLTEEGRAVARILPMRVAGLHENAMEMRDDFDAPLPDAFWSGEE
jgi:prevent-host-death family protein